MLPLINANSARNWHENSFALLASFALSSFVLLAIPSIFPSKISAEELKRPKVGLVLAGGGALGFAHVGVLEVLEANRIPVDLVTGTSMGSIVGAAYAAGVPLQEMKDLLNDTDWDELFGEHIERRGIPFRYKGGRNREIFGSVKFGQNDEGDFAIPLGVVEGQLVLPLLQRLYRTVPNPTSFDDLPLPFRAVTADIETGRAYVPDQGNLAKVVRASMSVPGFFSPVEIDGKVLVDGGIANNTPVDVALEMGADILIVVELLADLSKADELSSPFAISGQIISILLSQNSEIQRGNMRENDILLVPDIRGYSATDFPKGEEIRKKGETEANDMLATLRKLSLSEEEYAAYQSRRSGIKQDVPLRVASLAFINDSNAQDEHLQGLMGIKEGDEYDIDKIEEGIAKIYGTGFFSSVTYEATDSAEGKAINITAKEKEYLDDYYRFGMAFEDDFDREANFRLSIFNRTTNIFKEYDHLDVIGEIGQQPNFTSEYYRPFSNGSYFFFAPNVSIGRNNLSIREGKDRIARYHRLTGVASLEVGRQLGTVGEARIGYSRGFGDIERDIGDPALPDFGFDIGDFTADVDIDALDKPDFPTKGYRALFNFQSAQEAMGSGDSFNALGGALTLPYTWGRNTLVANGDFGVTFEDRPIERSFSLGGFLDVSGFERNALFASDYAVGRLIYFRNFSEVKIPFVGLDFFAGTSAEITTLQTDSTAADDISEIWSGSTFVGADTPLLPAYLGVGYNDEDEFAIYIALGRIGVTRQ